MKQTLIIDARPPAKLLPNRRTHWRDMYRKEVKDYLALIWIRCKEQKIHPVKGHATLTFIFYLKTNHRRDGDNWLAAMKKPIDVLVKECKLFIDDSSEYVSYAPVQFVIDKEEKTIIEIEETG